MEKIANFINGKSVQSSSGETTQIIDPSTGKAYAEAPKSNQADIDAAMSAAANAFVEWRDATPSERQRALLKIADAIESRAEEFIATESKNTGKPLGLTASEEIPPMVDQIRFFAGAARNLEGKSAGEYMRGMTSYIRREPIGVCAQVTPWNYPMMMAVWKWAPAIAAGNTVVLKPSETTPMSTILMANVMSEFLPNGVFNVVTGERESGKMLIDHATPAMVSLTGSVRAGMQVAEAASKSLKRVHLELGGKAPVVVFADADLKTAAETIAITGFFNAGQDCTAATRVIVEESAYEEFVELIAHQAKGLKTGAPSEDDALFGPVNNANQLARVTGFLNEVPSHARVVAGGKQVARDGFFIEPTVIADLKQSDRHIQEEIFGPVITVQRFKDEAEAIRMANGVEYGLASSIWTSNHGRAMRLSRAFDFGCVWINCHIPVVAEMPHGGYKRSGYGKDLSSYGFEDYTRIKHVMTNLNA
jgi:betaine-aldehyde dehydrogenase